MYLTGFFIVFFIIMLIFITAKNTTDSWKRSISQKFPPGPRPLPLIGNLHLMNMKRPQKTFLELSKKYGPIFSIQLGMKKMVVLAGYETIKDALVHHALEFGERAHVPIFEDINNGFGLSFAHGENWKVMRRFTLSTLRDFGMGRRTIEKKIIEESDFLIKHFQSHGGKPLNITKIMNYAVANIIISIVLGHRFDYDHPTLLMLIKLGAENVRLLGSPTVNLYNIYPVFKFLPGNHKTIHHNVKDMHSFLRKTFLKSRKELTIDERRNFIDAFLIKEEQEKAHPNSYFHDENLMCIVTALFMAGTDTTAATLRWGYLLMMKYPDIQRNVQEEIDRVLGSEHPNMGHRKLMPYTDAVIHEIQRFGNIVPLGVPRETTVDIYFKGYLIPKGTHIIPLLESALYDKTQFAKPEDFNPQHFLDPEGKFMNNDALMSFGAGRRICVGKALATMELFVFFTSLLQKFTLCLPPGVTHIDLTPAIGFTTPPMPYDICALPRS